MGSLYRSEEMRFCQLIVEKDAAFSCLSELGKRPYVEFKDLNADMNAFQRMFVRDVRRLDEMERKLRFFEILIKKEDIPIVDSSWGEEVEVMPHYEINLLKQTLTEFEQDVIHMNDSDQQLKKNFLELKEWQHVLQKTEEFFAGGIDDVASQEITEQQELEAGITLRGEKEPVGYIVGVINHEKVNAFERVLWRACRRTAFLRHCEIEEELVNPDTGEKFRESVFIVFYSGERLRSIIDRVSEGFRAKQYNQCPRNSPDRLTALKQVMANEQDMRTVMGRTQDHRLKLLRAVAVNHRAWLKQVRIHKSIYHTLNLFTFDGIGKFFVAECWVPLCEVDNVRTALELGVTKNGGSVKPVLNVLHTDETPPTYNITNKFTEVFQSIVDSYGVANYLELNPAPYTIITFPFLFSCMFGDLGHGALMFLCALYLVLREKNLEAKQIRDEIFTMFFGGRYIILLMGLFSMHAGILYNDAFAKSFGLFSSHWRNPYTMSHLNGFFNHTGHGHSGEEVKLELPPQFAFQKSMGPYPFGVDTIWNVADNKLTFLNSLKMKLSIILGIGQMTFGVALSLNNYRFSKSAIDIYTVFIPQLVFMGSIFIYLCLQIVAKWLFFWVVPDQIFGLQYPGSHCAPSLLNGLISMFMFKSRPSGYTDDHGKELESCYLNQWYIGQSALEAFLVIAAVICVPIMLFGKPAYIMMQRRRAKRAIGDSMSVRVNMMKEETEVVVRENGVDRKLDDKSEESHPAAEGGGGHGHHDESFGDIMVHQSIHTIEYVLGCVSHTASYLRLWALSLAHAQLSDVLWKMVLAKAFIAGGVLGSIATYLVFFAFGVLTFSILVLMEGLSAFLHALRLHWVEFQSKFYRGEGYPFTPFAFKHILDQASAADSTLA